MLTACVFMHDSDGDATSRQRYKHTAAPVTGFIILYGDPWGTEGQKHYLKLVRTRSDDRSSTIDQSLSVIFGANRPSN